MATESNISGAMKTLSSWEAQRDELLALQSIYCEEGECEVLVPANLSFEYLHATAEPNDFASPDYGGIVIRVLVKLEQATMPQGLRLSVVFHLGAGYPEEPPAVTEISSKDLPSHVTECIHKRLTTFISSLQPEPCLFEALERLKEEVVDLIAQDASLLSTPTLAIKERDSCSDNSDQIENNIIMTTPLAEEGQADKRNQASKEAGAKRTTLGGIPGVHVCIAKLDHMRNEQKYLKLLNSWAKDLTLYGKVLHTGPHSIYVVIVGVNDSGGASVSEFLKRWRTQNIDVDSQGRPCKERLLSILYQQQLSDCPSDALHGTLLGATVRSDASKDLWSIALEEKDRNDVERRKGFEGYGESNVFFVGSQNAGKTSIVLRFLEREESPKPTTALEYTYGRRSRGANIAKDIAHIWELGGGTFLSKLVTVPITAATVSNLSVVIVLDLSKPEELWTTLEVFIKQIRQRVRQVLAEVKSTDAALVERLRKKAWRKFGEDHPDKELLDPMLIPLAILGTKYDIFQDFEPEKKKIISKTLRFVAHTNGASLHFFSNKSDGLVNRIKQLISHLAFGTPLSRTMSMDYTKPLLVPAGTDALGQIGVPSLSAGDIGRISARNPLELWKQAYCGFYPQVSTQPEIADDPCRDVKYKEATVDSMRAQKDEELERYRRECERKAHELARQRGQVASRTPK